MSVPRVPFCKSGQNDYYKWQFHLKIPLMLAEQRSHSSGRHCHPSGPPPAVFSLPPEFILWHYKDVHRLADNGDDIFSLPHNDFPVFCSGRRLSSQATATQVHFFSHPCQTGSPALWRNESPGCFKAQPVSGLEGLAIHSLRIVLQATMGCMGARPFVIGSVVNSCWGNKSVTHLWLWIRSSLFFSSFFSLVSSETLPMAALTTSKVSIQTETGSPGQHPEQKQVKIHGLIFSFFPWLQFLSTSCDGLWAQQWLCCGTNWASPFTFPLCFPLSLHKSPKASVLPWHPCATFDPAKCLLSRLWWPHPSN